jgi:hypothetical protein
MSGFALDWLRAREPLDAAARSGECASRFAAALARPQGRPLRILDLASGSGSNFRALAPVVGGEQDWVLVDNDAALLAAQPAEIERWAQAVGWQTHRAQDGIVVAAPDGRWSARGRSLDLHHELERLDLSGFDAITTCAFLDLVSVAWLERFADLLARACRPLLAVLTVDGRRVWHPALPGDEAVLAAFARHQGGDKGFGPALGVEAAQTLARQLGSRGFEVELARSDWRIGPSAPGMLRRLLDGSVHAASEAQPARADAFAAWRTKRSVQLAAGTLSLEVGHLDLLALPVVADA